MPICTRCGAVFGDEVKHTCNAEDIPAANQIRRPGKAIEVSEELIDGSK